MRSRRRRRQFDREGDVVGLDIDGASHHCDLTTLGTVDLPLRAIPSPEKPSVSAHLGGHIGPASSSPGECGAFVRRLRRSSAALRSLRDDDVGPMRRSATVAFADQSRPDGRLCAAKTTESPKPEPRGPVKPRE